MFQRNGVGLDWATLFNLKEEKKDLIVIINNEFRDLGQRYNDYRIPIKEIEIHDEMYQQACQKDICNNRSTSM